MKESGWLQYVLSYVECWDWDLNLFRPLGQKDGIRKKKKENIVKKKQKMGKMWSIISHQSCFVLFFWPGLLVIGEFIYRLQQSEPIKWPSCLQTATSTPALLVLNCAPPARNTSTFSYLEVIFTKYIKKNIGLLARAYSTVQQLSVNISTMIILSKSKSQGKDSRNVTRRN